jgi:hypothetical protein
VTALLSAPTVPTRSPAMPPVRREVYQGLAGDIVRHLAPSTEADPVALLVTLLATAGAIVGDGPHVLIGGAKHPARIWPVLVGGTSSGRKGTAQSAIRAFVSSSDSYFVTERMKSGLSSGEGLVAILSPREDEQPDSRLLIVESEFTRVLGVTKREGNTLSAIMRTLWESGDAHVLTRADPLSTTGAHLVVIGHATPRELVAKMSDADVAGGFANRFMPVLVERSHLIYDDVDAPDHTDLSEVMRKRLVQAHLLDRVRRDQAADLLWRKTYRALNQSDREGPLGEVLARGAATIQRLSLIYALLDGHDTIGVEHLNAAVALWSYVTASAQQVFGGLSGNSDADRLADFLQSATDGRTRTEVSKFFGNNKSAEQIDNVLAHLDGYITTTVDSSGPGRAVVRTYWSAEPTDAVNRLLAGVPE